jgi:hypothetical protein
MGEGGVVAEGVVWKVLVPGAHDGNRDGASLSTSRQYIPMRSPLVVPTPSITNSLRGCGRVSALLTKWRLSDKVTYGAPAGVKFL